MKLPEKVSEKLRTLELAGPFPRSKEALSIHVQCDVQQYVRDKLQDWQEEVAGKMASHTHVWHAGEPDIPKCLHVDDPRALSGLTDQ